MSARRVKQAAPTMKPQNLVLTVLAAITLIAGAGIALPQIGNWMRVTVRLDETERDVKELKQVVRDQGNQVTAINSRLEKLETTVSDGNRRTEETLRNMTERFADVAASARAMEKSVATMAEAVYKSNATANNAIVRADKALDAVESATGKTLPQ